MLVLIIKNFNKLITQKIFNTHIQIKMYVLKNSVYMTII